MENLIIHLSGDLCFNPKLPYITTLKLVIDELGSFVMQFDTGCPYTFLREDFLLQQGLITVDYPSQLKYLSNESDQKFYYLENIPFTFLKNKYIFEKVFIEEINTAAFEDSFQSSDCQHLQCIGYLGIDFLKLLGTTQFDYKNLVFSTAILPDGKTKAFDFHLENNYIFLDLFCKNQAMRALIDTATTLADITISRTLLLSLYDQELDFENSLTGLRNDFLFQYKVFNLKSIFQDKNDQILEFETIAIVDEDFEKYLFQGKAFDFIIGNSFLRKNDLLAFDFIKNKIYC